MSELHYPVDQEIVSLCSEYMDVNSHKGNSWEDGQKVPLQFLLQKLAEEFSEFFLAAQKDHYMIKKEGADLINIASMIIKRYGK